MDNVDKHVDYFKFGTVPAERLEVNVTKKSVFIHKLVENFSADLWVVVYNNGILKQSKSILPLDKKPSL